MRVIIPHIIVFKDKDFKGDHLHLFDSIDKLPDNFNNAISSFVVLGGRWQMYDEPSYKKKIGKPFTVGVYTLGRAVKQELIDQDNTIIEGLDDKISSIELIGMC